MVVPVREVQEDCMSGGPYIIVQRSSGRIELDGRVFMPVPACDECDRWQRDGLEEVGSCVLLSRETKANFGCVEWEER